MCLEERPWENSHHCVSISYSNATPIQIISFETPEIIPSIYTTIQTLDSEGNMGNLSKTMIIDISVKTDIVENIQIGVDCNPKEIVSFTYLLKDFYNVFAWSW